jgi:hypothetical protein
VRPIDHVVEQLWAPALDSVDVRLTENASPEPGWTDAECYWLLPNARSARMLVPCGPRPALRGLLTNYRRLRTPRVNAVRSALGAAASLGLPLSRDRVSLRVSETSPDAELRLPTAWLASQLHVPLVTATGVRTSDNRKATLHLVDLAGRPVGYAKFGWNRATDDAVANEARTVTDLAVVDPGVRVPRCLGSYTYFGHPVLVVEPLPLDVRGGEGISPPTPQEIASFAAVLRHSPLADTGLFRTTRARLEAAERSHVAGQVASRASALAADLGSSRHIVPVASRWHGDFSPWNVARDGEDRLWVWDWESSEVDAPAGLDSLHWEFSRQRLRADDIDAMSLTATVSGAISALAAFGVGPKGRALLAAMYALTVVERACTLAASSGSWDDALIQPRGLAHLCREADGVLAS